MLIEEGEFRGHKILTIKSETGRLFFSGGVTKIKLLLENIETLKQFIDKYSKPETPT